MRECQQSIGLPAPKWCFIILGVPTFYMPLAYLSVAFWAIAQILAGSLESPPQWLLQAIYASPYVTFIMWPIYIAWVGLSTRLTLREKGWWLFIVLFLNMAGMPIFYVYMIRRYLGIEGRTNKRDATVLNHFLERHGISQDKLSPDQLTVLRSYCRQYRLRAWSVTPMLAISTLMLYTAIVFAPKKFIRSFVCNVPTHFVVIDSATDSKEEILPDIQDQTTYVQCIMMLGAMLGMAGAMGVFLLVMAISQVWGNWHRQALIEFLQASNRERI